MVLIYWSAWNCSFLVIDMNFLTWISKYKFKKMRSKYNINPQQSFVLFWLYFKFNKINICFWSILTRSPAEEKSCSSIIFSLRISNTSLFFLIWKTNKLGITVLIAIWPLTEHKNYGVLDTIRNLRTCFVLLEITW